MTRLQLERHQVWIYLAAIATGLVLGGVTVLMRLTQDDAGENRTVPPNRSSYTLSFEQVLI